MPAEYRNLIHINRPYYYGVWLHLPNRTIKHYLGLHYAGVLLYFIWGEGLLNLGTAQNYIKFVIWISILINLTLVPYIICSFEKLWWWYAVYGIIRYFRRGNTILVYECTRLRIPSKSCFHILHWISICDLRNHWVEL